MRSCAAATKESPPYKTTYYAGDRLDLTGVSVVGNYDIGEGLRITGYTFSPENGAVLTGDITCVTVSYTDGGITKTASFDLKIITDVTPTASVKKLNGNKNELTIVIAEKFSNGVIDKITETFSIDNNAAGTYKVGPYKVYVDTKGNTQIRECYIVK